MKHESISTGRIDSVGKVRSNSRELLLLICLIGVQIAFPTHPSWAGPVYPPNSPLTWTGLAGDGLWGNPTNWFPQYVPSSITPQVTLAPTNGSFSVAIVSNEAAGVGGTIFGPDSGMTLNILGSLQYTWVMAPLQSDGAPASRSRINMYGSASLSCNGGAGLAVGDQWWDWSGPFVTMNLSGNSIVTLTNGAGLWLGGHLDLYDSARFVAGAGGALNMDNQGALSDGTRAMILGGGALILPTGWTNSGSVYDWIARGILRAYGKGFDTNDLNISDNGTNTIVTPVALGGALSAIHFSALSKPTMMVGTFQQATLSGDYPSVTGVLLSSDEPGLDPASYAAPVYTSSNPGIVSVAANGMLTAVSPGTATITATVGALSTGTPLSVTVAPLSAALAHRYSFNETSGTTASDSVGGANATLMGTAAFDGAGDVVLDGNTNGQDFVQLPAGIVAGMSEVTVECWASFGVTATNNFENLFAFGNSDTDPLDSTFGQGGNYITFSPHTGGGTAQANFGQGLPGFLTERDAVSTGVLDGAVNMHVVAVFHPYAGYEAFYTNGVLAATISMFNNLIDPVAFSGPTYTNSSLLAFTLGADPVNYIGKSLYNADPGLLGSINEVRIYNGALSPGQIAADNALGPNQLIGASTTVSLTATPAGAGNVTISWPTNSAMVNLQSSPTLGTGAVWSPVIGALSISAGRYQITVPESGNAQLFRLQL